MKLVLLLTLSFLLLSFTTNFPFAFSQDDDQEQVLDTNGNPLFAANRYYILPAIFGAAGGGVRLGETGNSTCPLTVLQDYSEVETGQTVKFHIPQRSTGFIFTGTQLDITFEESPECATSSNWVVIVDDFPREWFGIGGAENHPGKQIISGSFNIEKYDEAYKLVFCSSSTITPSTCFDIGRYDDEKGRRLILTNGDDPYQVVFVDADATGSSTH